MTVELLTQFLGWCTLINVGLLMLWGCLLVFTPNWLYNIQSRWIRVSREQFNQMHFLLLGSYKLAVLFFNLIPYLVLCALI